MKRKDFIKKGAAGLTGIVAASTLLNGCKEDDQKTIESFNINSNKKINWRMTTVWGKTFPFSVSQLICSWTPFLKCQVVNLI